MQGTIRCKVKLYTYKFILFELAYSVLTFGVNTFRYKQSSDPKILALKVCNIPD